MLKKLNKTDRAEGLISPLKDAEGFILIIGLLILLLLTAIGAVALRTATTETQIVGNDRASNGLLFAADAGIERAKNQIWADSGFGDTSKTLNIATVTDLLTPLPKQIFTTSLASGLYYTVQATQAVNNGSYVDVTLESQAWRDSNGNSTYDKGEQTKTIVAKARYSYTSLDFPFGLMTQNTECIFCHTQINGDVVSLESMTIRKTDEAFSIINGKVYTAGTTNVNTEDSRVVKSYVDQNGNYSTVEDAGEADIDITENYTDPRFPIDENGNPSWPQIGNLTYYKGLAATYNGGAGSSVSGGTIKGVPTGSTYPAGAVNLTSVSQSYAGNLILDGTSSCIVLNGPIVADKDVIIKGCVQGTGNIYAGGNVYMGGSVTYNDSANDKLSVAAGGNIVMGDYTSAKTGGQGFIEKQEKAFNDAQAASGIPAGQRRYYADSSGAVPSSSKTSPVVAGDTIVSYTPTSNWISEANYTSNFLDTTNGIAQIDALLYTSNAIFGINKYGNQQTTINGALVSADTGILIPGLDGHDTTYNPVNIGLTLNYDSRMKDFLAVARNPVKKIVSWEEK